LPNLWFHVELPYEYLDQGLGKSGLSFVIASFI